MDSERLARIQRRFAEFGQEYAALPLYGAVARAVADDAEAASLLLVARPGQARPVLWFAALHDLVLRHPDLPAARWYASVVGREHLPPGDPWPEIRETAMGHRAELTDLMATRSTQTNEVNRSVYLAAGLALAAADGPHRPGVPGPIALVELGASAGLLLGIDRYDIELESGTGTTQLGRSGSPVRCRGLDRSRPPLHGLTLPPVEGRAGVDLHPVRLDDADAVRWLMACLWPDVPGRVERFVAARDLMLVDPPHVVEGDMLDAMPSAVSSARAGSHPDAHVVVFSSWALSYVAPERRADLAAAMDLLSRDVAELSWLTAEPAGCAPGVEQAETGRVGAGGTVLGLRRWRSGRERPPVALGTCHPHGEWLDLHRA
ncbi:hypothetical protein FHX52_1027 [Humibacillus xanthopallidus]|uniref:DUF2332 family protein n=1 Tax=Humibacillus xanthopallidus TaxID=412689 RepID=A0A543PV10_9MICO|nr:DUF2332 domain-containing protein [Humibacillus xanthopallidus]TQN47908.1 hypothetical protein FHX52_1027 [Humibacillus xanthopallidus]